MFNLAAVVLFMGQEIPIILIFSYVFWFMRKKEGAHLLFLILFSMILNAALKCYFKVPLKDHMAHLNWYAFPSGHMQMATVFYGALFWRFRDKTPALWFVPLGLGVFGWALIQQNYHDIKDVLAAGLIGLMILFSYFSLSARAFFDKNWTKIGLYLGVISVPLLYYVAVLAGQNKAHIWQAEGGLIGFSLGLMFFSWDGAARSFVVKGMCLFFSFVGFASLWVLNHKLLSTLGTPLYPALSFVILGLWLGGGVDAILHIFQKQKHLKK